MSIYQCENCGCAENTALGGVTRKTERMFNLFDWTGIESLRGKLLCSACSPKIYRDGKQTKFGKWHNVFERTYLPMNSCFTNDNGDLEHRETGLLEEEIYAKFGRKEQY